MPLVARTDEFAVLVTALELARSGQGRIVVVSGEPGSGRSTLLRRLLTEASGRGAALYATRSFVGDAAIPYAPWHSLLTNHDELSSRVPLPLGAAHPPAQGLAELSRRVSTAVLDVARERPVVLAFDDLDHTDESSLGLIRALAHELDSAPILLVLVISAPLPSSAALAGWLRLLAHESSVQHVDLAPIGESEIRQFVDDEYADLATPRRKLLSKFFAQLSGGNLLLLNETLLAVESGKIELDADRLDHYVQLPTTLARVVEHFAAHLSRRSLETLRLAALCGDRIDVELLAGPRGQSEDDIVLDLEEALALGLLTEDGDEIYFRHGAFRQSLIAQQSPLRRRRHHAAILGALEQRPEARAVDIALHAEHSGNLTVAYAALRRAAADAERAFALPEAMRLYRRALDAAERLDKPPEEQDRLRLAIADALIWNDRLEATREINRVITRAGIRGDMLTLAQAWQRKAVLLYEDASMSDSLDLLENAIPVLETSDDHKSLAQALTYAGYCYGSTNDFPALERIANQLLELAVNAREPAYRAIALQFNAGALVAQGVASGAPQMALESVEIMEELGRLDHAVQYAAVAFMRVFLVANLHEPDQIDDLIERGDALANLRSQRLGLDDVQELEFAYGHFLRGDWDMLRSALNDAFRLIDTYPQVMRDIVYNVAAELANAEGLHVEAEELLHHVAPTPLHASGEHSYQQWLMAVTRLVELGIVRNDLDHVQEWIDSMERALDVRSYVPGEVMLGLNKARLALARGDMQDTLALLKETQRRASETTNILALIQCLQLESTAQRLAGNVREALEAASAAVAEAGRCRLPYEVALSRLRRAEALRMMPGGATELRDDLAEAQQTFERLGAEAQLRYLRDLEVRDSHSRPAGLTSREMDVLRLVAKGLSDRQIGEQLFISPRTVTTHVGNLLGKTMTSNRTELAIWAVQQQLAEHA